MSITRDATLCCPKILKLLQMSCTFNCTQENLGKISWNQEIFWRMASLNNSVHFGNGVNSFMISGFSPKSYIFEKILNFFTPILNIPQHPKLKYLGFKIFGEQYPLSNLNHLYPTSSDCDWFCWSDLVNSFCSLAATVALSPSCSIASLCWPWTSENLVWITCSWFWLSHSWI